MATRTARPAREIGEEQFLPDAHRVLVLAGEPICGRALVEEIARHARHPKDDVVVIAPALVDSTLKLGAGEVDSARARAERRLSASVEALRRAGLHATGEVGDADPNVALTDALRSSPADEVIVTTHPSEQATGLEEDVIERALHELHRPITQVVVGPGQGASASVTDVRDRLPDEDDGEQQVDYLPPLPLRDRVALLIGICGTIALGVLAMFSPGHTRGSLSGAFAARFLIAIGAFMITLWHAVALLVFGSVGYRGKWEKLAAYIVLFGVPAAVVLSVIVAEIFPSAAH
jgi:hypothetical protein